MEEILLRSHDLSSRGNKVIVLILMKWPVRNQKEARWQASRSFKVLKITTEDDDAERSPTAMARIFNRHFLVAGFLVQPMSFAYCSNSYPISVSEERVQENAAALRR